MRYIPAPETVVQWHRQTSLASTSYPTLVHLWRENRLSLGATLEPPISSRSRRVRTRDRITIPVSQLTDRRSQTVAILLRPQGEHVQHLPQLVRIVSSGRYSVSCAISRLSHIPISMSRFKLAVSYSHRGCCSVSRQGSTCFHDSPPTKSVMVN